MGSYMEHITANHLAGKDLLMKDLDSFLERDRDLFGVDSLPESTPEGRESTSSPDGASR